MKKKWIIGALVTTTGLQASLPVVAGTKEGSGQILGAVTGALLGSQVGGGNGKVAATVVGAIAGSIIGGNIGRRMDEADRRAFYEAQRYCFSQSGNTSRSWSGRQYGSRTDARGTFATARQGRHYRTNEICREYSSSIYFNGKIENTTGIACQRSDGSFYEVRSSEVRFVGESRTVYRDNGPLLDQDDDTYDRDQDRYDRNDRRRDDDRYDRDERYNQGYNNGQYFSGRNYDPRLPAPPGQGGISIPVPPPSQVPAPGTGNHYQGFAQVQSITRMDGGGWYRVSFDRPVTLSSIDFRVRGAGLKVYSTVVVTEAGQRLQVPELSNTPVLDSRTPAAGFFNRAERVIAIDVRAESFRGLSDLTVRYRSPEQSPVPRIQQFFIDFR